MKLKYRKDLSFKRWNLLFLSGLILLLLLTGCNKNNSENHKNSEKSPITKSSFLLNTYVTVTIYDMQDEGILDECFQLIEMYETIFSRTDPNSELYKLNTKINQNEKYQISKELSLLLEKGLYYSKLSEGNFDITIEPVSSLWDFSSNPPRLPEKDEIQRAISRVDYKSVILEDQEVTFLKDGMGFDLGAIAKGYIADQVKEFLIDKGVGSAIINLGGNVLCLGSKPGGQAFKVGIQKPYADRNETIAIMELSDMSVVSSGVYERFFVKDGVSYHHILNPATGYPLDYGLISVTIISEKSVDGDGLSTTCFALGLEKGLDLINQLPNTYGVFITSDYEIHYSQGFTDAIPLLK